MMLTNLKGEGEAKGRGQGTAIWAGLANLFWWCDREKGVAAMIASQILPLGGAYGLFHPPLSPDILRVFCVLVVRCSQ